MERGVILKTFFDGIFMDKEKLKAEGMEYPIKLEYYKIVSNEENVDFKYGMEIVKIEYKNGEINIENSIAKNITNNEKQADEILTIMKNNEVTPIGMQDVLMDLQIN